MEKQLEVKECKQCNPCLSNILSAQDSQQWAVNELNALLSESDHLSATERELLRSIRTYIRMAHNALNHIYTAQGRKDLIEHSSDKLRGKDAWGGEKNEIREKMMQK